MIQPDVVPLLPVPVRYYTGHSAKVYMAEIFPVQNGFSFSLVCSALDLTQQYLLEDCEVLSKLSQTDPVLLLPDDGRIELLTAHIPEWLQQKNNLNYIAHRLEHSKRWIVLATLVSLLCIVGFLFLLVPYGADIIARQLPESTMQKIGDETEWVIRQQTKPSTLLPERQTALRQKFAQYIDAQHPDRLYFVAGGDFLGANAFALPNNHIYVTDELIDLSKNDLEVMAVLAHEKGHVQLRHNLRQALSAMGISIGITWLTGDTSDLISGLPAQLVQLDYSRKFEREADAVAKKMMQEKGIPLYYFANILLRITQQSVLEESDTKKTSATKKTQASSSADQRSFGDKVLEMLQTHPDTQERIKPFVQDAVLVNGEYQEKMRVSN